MAETYEIRYQDDERVIHEILGIPAEDPLPEGIAKEYSMRLIMLHRGGVTGRMPLSDIVTILRGLKLQPKREDRKVFPEVPPDWRDVEAGTRVIIQTPDFPNEILRGTFKGCRGSSSLTIDIPNKDPRILGFAPKYVKIDHGQLEDLARAATLVADEWSEVPLGCRVLSHDDDGKEIDGILAELGPGPNRLTLLLGSSGKTICVDRDKSSISDEAMATL
jgi:hypothetical protein